jgi:hypothetical protein
LLFRLADFCRLAAEVFVLRLSTVSVSAVVGRYRHDPSRFVLPDGAIPIALSAEP